jgi:DNA polymerase-1
MNVAFEHALFRGAYMAAAAHVELTGVPLDAALLAQLRAAWPDLKADVLRGANAKYGFWDEQLHFKMGRFEQWLDARGYAWPRTPTGRPSLDRDILEDMAKAVPAIAEFRDVRHATSGLRLERIAIDEDGRNRLEMLSAFRTITGRNAPKASQFIFGPARWLRHLIVAPPGRALAYVDWSAQEFGVMAALSGDRQLLDDYRLGDPYLSMAIRLGRAPAGAARESHSEVRDQFKIVVLATGYGMGAGLLQVKLQVPLTVALQILQKHRETYRQFWSWSDRIVDIARIRRQLYTPLGWRITVAKEIGDRTLRNWPVQSSAADMMRYALVHLVRAGIQVDAVIHDAFLIEADAGGIDRAVTETQVIMAGASRKVLREVLTLRTSVAIVPPGGRYQEPRGSEMWQRAMRLLGRADVLDELSTEPSVPQPARDSAERAPVCAG